MGDSSEKQHDNMWSELTRLRERQHALANEVTGLVLHAEQCVEMVGKVNVHDKEIALMAKDVADLKEIEKGRTAKMIAVIGLTVPIAVLFAQGLWWLFTGLKRS